jgi:hypothetical protein
MRLVSSFRGRDVLVAHEVMILEFLPSSAQMEEYVDQNEVKPGVVSSATEGSLVPPGVGFAAKDFSKEFSSAV